MMNKSSSSSDNNNCSSRVEDRSLYCKYCLEYYYVKNQNDIVEHTTSMNHLMNISRNRHSNTSKEKETIDLQRKSVDNNERQKKQQHSRKKRLIFLGSTSLTAVYINLT